MTKRGKEMADHLDDVRKFIDYNTGEDEYS